MMKKIKGISLFDITVFLGVEEKKFVKSIKSANYYIEKEKEMEGSFIIKIPNIKFQEKKVILLFVTIEKKKFPKRNILDLLKSKKNSFVKLFFSFSHLFLLYKFFIFELFCNCYFFKFKL